MSDPYPLSNLGRQIKAHWRKYRPKMYRALEKAGKLDESVYAAQELTGNTLADLVHKGMDWNQAWELIREEWAFLPAEEDEEERDRQQQPDPAILIEEFERRQHAKPGPGSDPPVRPEPGSTRPPEVPQQFKVEIVRSPRNERPVTSDQAPRGSPTAALAVTVWLKRAGTTVAVLISIGLLGLFGLQVSLGPAPQTPVWVDESKGEYFAASCLSSVEVRKVIESDGRLATISLREAWERGYRPNRGCVDSGGFSGEDMGPLFWFLLRKLFWT